MPDHRPPLHLLVVVPGARPAPLIEEAILRLRDEGCLPHEVHVLAHRDRVDDARRELLEGRRFTAFCESHGLRRDEIVLNGRTLHPLPLPLPPDCATGTDRLLTVLRSLAASKDTALTVAVSEDAGIAGHLVHACFQLVARIDDRLVLYPLRRRPGGPNRASCPPVDLPLLLRRPDEPVGESYAEATTRRRAALRRLVRPDVLRLEPRRRLVRVGETVFVLPAMQFFWLWHLAGSAGERFPLADLTAALSGSRRHAAQVTQHLSDGRVRVFPQDLQRAFAQMFPAAVDKFEPMFVRACGPHPGLPSTISKINAAFRRALGPGAQRYLIEGGRGAGGYRITLPPSAIQIAGRS